MAASLKLNNGTTASGATKLVSLSLGKLDKDAWNASKVLALKDLIAPCLALEVEDCVKTETSSLYDDGNE